MKMIKSAAAAVLAVAMLAAVSMPVFAAEGVDSVHTNGTNVSKVDTEAIVVDKGDVDPNAVTQITITSSAELNKFNVSVNPSASSTDNLSIQIEMNKAKADMKENKDDLAKELADKVGNVESGDLKVVDMFDVTYWVDYAPAELGDNGITFPLTVAGTASDTVGVFHYEDDEWQLVATSNDADATFDGKAWKLNVHVKSLSPFAVMSTTGNEISLNGAVNTGSGHNGNGGVVNSPKTGEGMGMAGIGALVCLMAAAYCVKRAKQN